MAIVTVGLPERFNPPLPAILLPTPVAQLTNAEVDAGNNEGQKVLLWGDSHAGHLIPGFLALRDTIPLRIYGEGFGDCPPTRVHPASMYRHCVEEIDTIQRRIAALQPDIAILASYWPYQDRLEGLSEPLTFLQSIQVSRIVVMGYVPRWPKALRKVVVRAYLKQPLQPVPERLPNFVAVDPNVDRYLRDVSARFGARYISPMQVLCNDAGCLVRVGDRPGDLMQFDDNHLSVAGSRFFVRSIASQVLN